MIVIPVTCESGAPEWCMVEMQGELERKDALNPDDEYPIGKITLSSTRPDTVELVIGYHLLEGKMVDLKKPFAILEKHSAGVDAKSMNVDEKSTELQSTTEYKVIGVVRKKCLFKNRPRAIISKPEPATRKQRGQLASSAAVPSTA